LRKVALVLVVFLILITLPASTVFGQEFELQSEAALLMEPVTGEVLYSHNGEEKLYPASITKVMTMLLAMEALEEGKVSLDDIVTVSPYAASMGGSQIFLSPGDQVRFEDLLIGVAVGSGNDAAVAVAEHIAGSEEEFAKQMNLRAKALGMRNTNFTNSHGLHDQNHYTTAVDIAKMSRALLNYPQIHEWLTIWMDEHFLEGEIAAGEVYLSNTNRLIRYYQGADGLKTGYTPEAGYCLVATAKRGDTRFLSVVLKAPSGDVRYQESRQLLDYAFAHYMTVPLAAKGEKLGSTSVERGAATSVEIAVAEPLALLVKKGEDTEYDRQLCLEQPLVAPIACGQVVGELAALKEGNEVKRVPVISTQAVAKAGFTDYFHRLFCDWVRFGR